MDVRALLLAHQPHVCGRREVRCTRISGRRRRSNERRRRRLERHALPPLRIRVGYEPARVGVCVGCVRVNACL